MKAINSGIRNAGRPGNLEPVAKKLVTDIKRRTKDGKEAKKLGADETNFKGLAPATIEKRRRAARSGNLSRKTTPSKSNQIFRDKMVKSLTQETSVNEITLKVAKDQEKKLLGNQQLGRNFLQLSKKNLSRIAQSVTTFIAAAIERDLK